MRKNCIECPPKLIKRNGCENRSVQQKTGVVLSLSRKKRVISGKLMDLALAMFDSIRVIIFKSNECTASFQSNLKIWKK